MGAEPPVGFNYELFLDEKGQKISKSKGNGLSIEEWLTYASPESLSLFMFQRPSAAKRLYFDVIPRTVDDYLNFLDAYPRQEWKERLGKAKGATPQRPGVSNEFFNMIYAVLLGEARGPRLGSFIALYGIEETRALIANALAGELLKTQGANLYPRSTSHRG